MRVVVHGSQVLLEGAAAGVDATGHVHWMILSGYLYPVCLRLEGHLPTSGGRGGSGRWERKSASGAQVDVPTAYISNLHATISKSSGFSRGIVS